MLDQTSGLGKSTVDINAPGQYEGQNIYDVDLDSFEEKPWRKPGIYQYLSNRYKTKCLYIQKIIIIINIIYIEI